MRYMYASIHIPYISICIVYTSRLYIYASIVHLSICILYLAYPKHPSHPQCRWLGMLVLGHRELVRRPQCGAKPLKPCKRYLHEF